jgi:hypothetical protein
MEQAQAAMGDLDAKAARISSLEKQVSQMARDVRRKEQHALLQVEEAVAMAEDAQKMSKLAEEDALELLVTAREEAEAQAEAIIENARNTARDLMSRSPGGKGPVAAEEAWKDTASVIETAACLYADECCPPMHGGSGFLLYGARAINCYIEDQSGLHLETKDYDFKLLHSSIPEFVKAVEKLCRTVRERLKGSIEMGLATSAAGVMHLQVNQLRVMDFVFMGPDEYDELYSKFGAPRLADPYVNQHGERRNGSPIPVMPFRQLRDSITAMANSVTVAQWRRQKGARQLQRMRIAESLGKTTDLPLETKAVIQAAMQPPQRKPEAAPG